MEKSPDKTTRNNAKKFIIINAIYLFAACMDVTLVTILSMVVVFRLVMGAMILNMTQASQEKQQDIFLSNKTVESLYQDSYRLINDAIQALRKAVIGRDIIFTLKTLLAILVLAQAAYFLGDFYFTWICFFGYYGYQVAYSLAGPQIENLKKLGDDFMKLQLGLVKNYIPRFSQLKVDQEDLDF